MGLLSQPRAQEQAVGQGPWSHTAPWGMESLGGGMRGMAGTLGGQCGFLWRERESERESQSRARRVLAGADGPLDSPLWPPPVR